MEDAGGKTEWYVHSRTGHNGAADPGLVNERSTSRSRWLNGWPSGKTLSWGFFLFEKASTPVFATVERHGAKRDPNCARLVKDQPPPSFKKRLRSYSSQDKGRLPFSLSAIQLAHERKVENDSRVPVSMCTLEYSSYK